MQVTPAAAHNGAGGSYDSTEDPLDVKSAYPYTEIFVNISRETTVMELSSIEGVSERDRRIIGLNLTGGKVNAVELCTRAFGLPQLDVLLDDYEKTKKAA